MDLRTDVSAAFALRLSADLLTAVVVAGFLSKEAANALVDDALNALLLSHPEYDGALREIAATITAQIALVSIDVERRLSRD